MGPHDYAYILLGIILIATFIALFFFVYVAKVEEKVVRNQITDIVNDLTDGSHLLFNKDALSVISNIIETQLTMPDMAKEDADVMEHNKELKTKAVKWFGISIGIGMIIFLIMWKKYNLNLTEIVKYSLITLALVALTEYLFVTIVSKNYVIVDPNYARYLISKILRDYANSK